MGIFNTILFSVAALAAVTTILSTTRMYASDFAALRGQIINGSAERLIMWRIVEPQRSMQERDVAIGSRVRSPADREVSHGSWPFVPLPSLAA